MLNVTHVFVRVRFGKDHAGVRHLQNLSGDQGHLLVMRPPTFVGFFLAAPRPSLNSYVILRVNESVGDVEIERESLDEKHEIR